MLARSHGYSAGSWATHNYYHADGGGNITMLIDASPVTVASYRYDCYGNIITMSGGLASANLYRFSSKELMYNSGLYYYGYRFYDPNLQRWPNRDRIGDSGSELLIGRNENVLFRNLWHKTPTGLVVGWHVLPSIVALDLFIGRVMPSTMEVANLYGYVRNNPVDRIDSWGLVSLPPGWAGPREPYRPDCNPFAGPSPCVPQAAVAAATCAAAAAACLTAAVDAPVCVLLGGDCLLWLAVTEACMKRHGVKTR